MIHLVDLSTYQRNVRYGELARAVSGGWVKCSDAKRVAGGSWMPFLDDMHETHTRGMRSAGSVTGSYCFAHPTQDPITMVDFFLTHAFFDQLRLVLDYESLADGKIPGNAGAHCKIAVERIRDHSGTSPLIYSSTSYAAEMVRQCPALAVEDWWAAAYPGRKDPPETLIHIPGVEDRRVLAWQWTGSGRLPGVDGDVDRDVAHRLEPLYVVAPDRATS